MLIINYADFTTSICQTDDVILDFKLFDIPSTMRRNVEKCAKFGAIAVTVADDPLNGPGIVEAKKAGEEYGIQIIVGDPKTEKIDGKSKD